MKKRRSCRKEHITTKEGHAAMGVLREELRANLLNAGAVIVGFGSLRGNEKLPYPALPQAVSYAVKLEPAGDTVWDYARAYFAAGEKIALLAEHAKACLRRYGFSAEVMPRAFMDGETPVTEFPDQAAAIAAGLGTRNAEGLTETPEHGVNVRFGTVFTDATWKKNEA